MCGALFVATAAFVQNRARVVAVFPEWVATPAFRTAPARALAVAMGYWLWRVRTRGSFA